MVLRQTPWAVTFHGALSVFIENLGKIGFQQQASEYLPARVPSANAITFTAFLIAAATRLMCSQLLMRGRVSELWPSGDSV